MIDPARFARLELVAPVTAFAGQPGGPPVAGSAQVVNRGRVIDEFDLRLEGLDRTWFDVTPTSGVLFPEEQADIALEFRVPAAALAGSYPFRMGAYGRAGGVPSTVDATLDVGEIVNVQMELLPQRRRARHGASYQARLRNQGNAVKVVRLSVGEAGGALRAVLNPDEFAIPPGSEMVAQLRLHPVSRSVFGRPTSYVFVLSAWSSDDDLALPLAQTTGELFIQPPLSFVRTAFWWAQRLAPVALLLLGLFGAAIWTAAPRVAPLAFPPPTALAGAPGADSTGALGAPGALGAQGGLGAPGGGGGTLDSGAPSLADALALPEPPTGLVPGGAGAGQPGGSSGATAPASKVVVALTLPGQGLLTLPLPWSASSPNAVRLERQTEPAGVLRPYGISERAEYTLKGGNASTDKPSASPPPVAVAAAGSAQAGATTIVPSPVSPSLVTYVLRPPEIISFFVEPLVAPPPVPVGVPAAPTAPTGSTAPSGPGAVNVRLSWAVNRATRVLLDGALLDATSGSVEVLLEPGREYVLQAENVAGEVTRRLTLPATADAVALAVPLPGIPGLSSVPGLSGVPGSATVEIPGLAGTTGTPAIPAIPGVPPIPAPIAPVSPTAGAATSAATVDAQATPAVTATAVSQEAVTATAAPAPTTSAPATPSDAAATSTPAATTAPSATAVATAASTAVTATAQPAATVAASTAVTATAQPPSMATTTTAQASATPAASAAVAPSATTGLGASASATAVAANTAGTATPGAAETAATAGTATPATAAAGRATAGASASQAPASPTGSFTPPAGATAVPVTTATVVPTSAVTPSPTPPGAVVLLADGRRMEVAVADGQVVIPPLAILLPTPVSTPMPTPLSQPLATPTPTPLPPPGAEGGSGEVSEMVMIVLPALAPAEGGEPIWLMEVLEGGQPLGYMRLMGGPEGGTREEAKDGVEAGTPDIVERGTPDSIEGGSGEIDGSKLEQVAPGTQRVVVPLSRLTGEEPLRFISTVLEPLAVANHDAAARMWSSPFLDAADFGTAAEQFTTFQVLGPQVGGRIPVFNPFTGNFGWIDALGVGPAPLPVADSDAPAAALRAGNTARAASRGSVAPAPPAATEVAAARAVTARGGAAASTSGPTARPDPSGSASPGASTAGAAARAIGLTALPDVTGLNSAPSATAVVSSVAQTVVSDLSR